MGDFNNIIRQCCRTAVADLVKLLLRRLQDVESALLTSKYTHIQA